jgi:hypothetical protein
VNWYPGLAGSRYATRSAVMRLLEIEASKAVQEALQGQIDLLTEEKASEEDLQSLSGVVEGLDERVGNVETGKLGILEPATGIHGSVQSLSGAGEASLTTHATAITTTAGYGVVTLGNGSLGQVKILALVGQSSPGDTIDVVPDNTYGFEKVTLSTLGQAVMMQWLGAWVQISGGVAPPVGPPTPEMTQEIEFVTANGMLFMTADDKQFAVQEE